MQYNPPPRTLRHRQRPGDLRSFGVVHRSTGRRPRSDFSTTSRPGASSSRELAYAHSNNLDKLYPRGGAEIELLGTVADTIDVWRRNVLWDATPAVRFGLSGQYTQVATSTATSRTTSAASFRRSTRSRRRVTRSRRTRRRGISPRRCAGNGERRAWRWPCARWRASPAGARPRRLRARPHPQLEPMRASTTPSRAAGPRRDAAAASDAAAVEVGSAPDEDDATAAARLNGLICKRPRCCVTRVMPAGVGADGTRYTVVRVDLLPGRRRCAPPQTGEQQDVVDPQAIKANEGGETDDKQARAVPLGSGRRAGGESQLAPAAGDRLLVRRRLRHGRWRDSCPPTPRRGRSPTRARAGRPGGERRS